MTIRAAPAWKGAIAAAAGLLLSAGLLSGAAVLAADDAGDADRPESSAPPANAAALDVAYAFDADDLIPLTDASLLPAPRGAVTARWYMSKGWLVVVFEGLHSDGSSPLCLGTSVFDAESGRISQVSFSPMTPGACDDAGVGALPLASADTGVRTCGETVTFVTRIPAEAAGPYVADMLLFPGDGTAVGMTGRLEEPASLDEIDAALVDCGPHPPPRVPRPATPAPEPTPEPVPAPPSQGIVPASERAPAPSPPDVEECPEVTGDGLQDVVRGPASPYLVKHPSDPNAATPTIIFLPGGGGSYATALRTWQTIFSEGRGFEHFRVVIPYSVDAVLLDEAMRTFSILDEVLACHGGDPMAVHLGGTSNGGLAAFGLMSRHPERFATLAGLPGAFPVQDPASVDPEIWLRILGGRAVFNGVGAVDLDWRPEVIATHNALAAAGIESVYVEFRGQGHVPGGNFDNSELLRFWQSH